MIQKIALSLLLIILLCGCPGGSSPCRALEPAKVSTLDLKRGESSLIVEHVEYITSVDIYRVVLKTKIASWPSDVATYVSTLSKKKPVYNRGDSVSVTKIKQVSYFGHIGAYTLLFIE